LPAAAAGTPEHLYDALTTGKADAALVASMLHYGEYTVAQIKRISGGAGDESQKAEG
jgi:cyclase